MHHRPRSARTANSPPRRRGGFFAIALLVILALLSAWGAMLLKLAVAQRLQVQGEQRRLQCEWLAEAGLERAAARFARDSKYRKETWDIPADSLGGRDRGVVTINIEPAASGSYRMSVTAEFPRDTAECVRITRTLPLAVAAREAHEN